MQLFRAWQVYQHAHSQLLLRNANASGLFHCNRSQSGHPYCGRDFSGRRRAVSGEEQGTDAGADGRRNHGPVCLAQHRPDSGDVRQGTVAGAGESKNDWRTPGCM